MFVKKLNENLRRPHRVLGAMLITLGLVLILLFTYDIVVNYNTDNIRRSCINELVIAREQIKVGEIRSSAEQARNCLNKISIEEKNIYHRVTRDLEIMKSMSSNKLIPTIIRDSINKSEQNLQQKITLRYHDRIYIFMGILMIWLGKIIIDMY